MQEFVWSSASSTAFRFSKLGVVVKVHGTCQPGNCICRDNALAPLIYLCTSEWHCNCYVAYHQAHDQLFLSLDKIKINMALRFQTNVNGNFC